MREVVGIKLAPRAVIAFNEHDPLDLASNAARVTLGREKVRN
jgi:hypothetical protein